MVVDGFRSMSISVSISDVFRAGEFRVVAWSVQHFKRQPRKMVKHSSNIVSSPPLNLWGVSRFWNLDKEGGHEKKACFLKKSMFSLLLEYYILSGKYSHML